jgi:hypothetical protein
MRVQEPRKELTKGRKMNPVLSAPLALAAIAVLTFASCSKSREAARSQSDQPGTVVAVETATTTATVEAIDQNNRTVTLRYPDGSISTYKAGKDMTNFDQIRVGDKVNATVVESVAVAIRKSGAPPSAGEAVTVSLAPKSAKPGMIISDTQEVTSRIESVDTANRTITLEEVGGRPRTIKVAPNVNLADFKKGDDVVVRYTDAVALSVEKP